jgi:hypothetical protein
MAIKFRLPRRRFFHVRNGKVELVLGLLMVTLLEARANASEANTLDHVVENQPELPDAAANKAPLDIDLDAVKEMSVEELKAMLTPELLAQLGLSGDFLEALDTDLKAAIRELEAAFRKKLATAAAASHAKGESDGDSHDGAAAHAAHAQDDADADGGSGGDLTPLLIIGGLVIAGGALAFGLSGGDSEPQPGPPPNRAPTAANDTFTTNEDTAVTFDVRTNDTDPDGNALVVTHINGTAITTASPVTIANVGTVSLGADGRLTFTPAANFNGAPTFTYTVSDGAGGTANGTVNGTVTAVNDVPVAVADTFTVAEDGTVTVNVRANDTDADGNTLTITHVNGTAITTATPVTLATGVVSLLANGQLSFTPNPNYNGAATFTYTVSDGAGGSSTATVTGTVTPVNDAPVAVNDTFTIAEDGTITFDVRANDTDVDGNALAVTHINGTAITTTTGVAVTGGTVTLGANGQLTFTPTANFNGSPTFTYTVSDGNGGTATASVAGTVTPVADAPVNANPGPINATSGAAVLVGGLAISDPDGAAGTFTTTITVSNGALAVGSVPGGATVTGSGTGSVTISGTLAQVNASLGLVSYTSGPGFNGTATLTMTTSDGGLTDTDTFNISVGAVQNGIVQDGYIEGAQVFYDANGNGTHDDGEPIAFTDAEGRYSLAIPDGATGSVLALGGTNVDTGLPNFMPLKAPVGATVVNPLTTLVATLMESGTSLADAQAAVSTALGLPPGTDLTNVDFLAPGVDPDLALAVQKQAAQVAQLITDAIEKGVDPAALINAIAESAENGETIDLTDPDALAGLLIEAGADPSVAEDVANAAAAVNQKIDAAEDPSDISAVQGEYNQPGANLPVSADDDAATTNLGEPVTLNVLANDVDPEGAALILTEINGQAVVFGQPIAVDGGTVVVSADGTVTFTPGVGVAGPVEFDYTVSDGSETNTGTVTVRVRSANGVVDVTAADLPAFISHAPDLAGEGVTGFNVTDAPATIDFADVEALANVGISFTEGSEISVTFDDADGLDVDALAAVNVDHLDYQGDDLAPITEIDAITLIGAGIDFVESDDVTLQADGTHASVTLKGMQDLNIDSVKLGRTSLVVEAGAALGDLDTSSLPQFDVEQSDASSDVTLNLEPGAIEPGIDLAGIASALDAAGVDHLGGDGVSLTLGQAEILEGAGLDFADSADVTLALGADQLGDAISGAGDLAAFGIDHLDAADDVLLTEGDANALITAGLDFVDSDNVTLQADGTHASVTLKGMQDLNIDSVKLGRTSLIVDAGAALGDLDPDSLPQFDVDQSDDSSDITLNIEPGDIGAGTDLGDIAAALGAAGVDHISSDAALSLSFDQVADIVAGGIDFADVADVTVDFADAALAGIAGNADILADAGVDHLHAIDGSATLSDADASALVGAGVDFAEGDNITVEAGGTNMSTTLKGLHSLNVDTVAVADGLHAIKLDAGDLSDITAAGLPQFDVEQTDASTEVTLFVGDSDLDDVARLADALREAGIDHFSVDQPLTDYDSATQAQMAQIAADSGIDFVYDPDHVSPSPTALSDSDDASDHALMRDLISAFESGHDLGHGGAYELTDGTLSSLVESGALRAYTADHLVIDGTGGGDHLLTTLKEIADFGVDEVKLNSNMDRAYIDLGTLDDSSSVSEISELLESLTSDGGDAKSIFAGAEKVALVVEADAAHALSKVDLVLEKLAQIGFTEIDVLATPGVEIAPFEGGAIEVKVIGQDEDLYRHLHDR